MEKIITILESVDLCGFTELLEGDKLGRYVVAFTDNKSYSFDLLQSQYQFYKQQYKNLTIGGWTNPEGEVIVDIGTCTNSLYTAIRLGIKYNQDAIRDSKEMREV